ncbi:MAG TPA: ABC transporter permease subunit, partial [Gemmatimonadaceae bacterium]|nr:ABC transporter permease subunit [Gemmatimonadaceae bacterium]
MLRYLARRLAQAAVIVAIVAAITFTLIHLAPGDPFSAVLDNPNVTEKVRQTLRAQYGLDRPLPEQFVKYVGSLARGNLGWSFSHERAVSEVLATALPNTLLLMGVALVGSFALGILVALLQVARRGSITDKTLSGVSLFFFSMPDFWLALLALLTFTYWLPIFPVGGAFDSVMHEYMGWGARIVDRLKHLALPALTLTLLAAATVARYQRAALLDVLPADYIRTARLKGLTERQILRLMNAVNRYDPTAGTEFLAYAIPTMLGEVKRYFRDCSWSVNVPRRLKDLYPALGPLTAELTQRLGRSPTAGELAEALGVDRTEVVETLT